MLFDSYSPTVIDRQVYVKDLCKAQKSIIEASRKFQDSVIKLRAGKYKPASDVVTLGNGDFVLATTRQGYSLSCRHGGRVRSWC